MSKLVREAIAAGAAGFATSFAVTHLGADGQPIPSRWAAVDEIEAMFRAVADAGRGVVGINGGENFGFRDTYELQLRVGVPVTYTALLTLANGAHRKAIEIHRAGRARGADVWPQVSCRPLTFSMTMVEPFTLNTSPVFAELMAGSLDGRRAAYGDHVWRQRVRDGWAAGKGIPPRWDTYEVMESDAHPELVGRRLLDLTGGQDPFDTLLDLALDEADLRRLRVKATLANDDAEGVADLLQQEGCTLGLSDAGAHVGQLCDAPLPTDLLGHWVRERGVLTLEVAINKLTKVQADLFGFADRGVVREGAWADLVVFDPDTVAPGPLRRLHDFPAGAERLTADQPTGMRHLLVNGAVVQADGQFGDLFDRRPGQVVSPAPR